MIPINLRGKLTGGPEKVKQLRAFGDALRDELRQTGDRLAIDLQLLVKQKLSGPVLKTVTGNLKGSINWKATDKGPVLEWVVGTSVGAIPYARIHEFGGIIVPKVGDYLHFKTADGNWHTVKQVVMPERSYLRSSLLDRRQRIIDELGKVPMRAAQKAGLLS